MAGKQIGERIDLARSTRKRLATYLAWMQGSARSEDRAHAALMLAARDLEKLIGMHEGWSAREHL